MICYIRFNPTRKKEFQLLTTIEKEKGVLCSYKKSTSKESDKFLCSLIEKYSYLKKSNLPFKILKPKLNKKGIRFDYILGKSLDEKLFEALLRGDRGKIINIFNYYKKLILKIPSINTVPGEIFEEYFGKVIEKKKIKCLVLGGFDFILENIFIVKNHPVVLDYEWTFPTPIPVKFVFFRSIMYSYLRYTDYKINKLISMEELLQNFGISKEDEEEFLKFEYNFQNFVNEEKLDFQEYKRKYNLLKKNIEFRSDVENILLQKEKISQLNQVISQKDDKIIELEKSVDYMRSSKFWKLRGLYIGLKNISRSPLIILEKIMVIFKREGIWGILVRLKRFPFYREKVSASLIGYKIWIKKNESFDKKKLKKEIKNLKYKPKISIITPVYNVDPKWLNKCIESVRDQIYENWEFCLYDDASTNKETINCLKEWEKKDSRIKISYGKVNQHISGASNEALKMATGEFIALLDNDDEISPNALYEDVKLLNKHPNADMIYSDEDKLSAKGRRIDPFFKPDWSPDLFLSMMYTCHLGVYRKEIIDEIGGFRKGYEGSQDYDLVLRFIDKIDTENIYHIPKILYHWRTLETSTALSASSKNYAYESAKKALRDYLKRNKIKGKVEDANTQGSYRVKREIKNNPLVSIIIPFKDQIKTLKRCLNSISEKTEYNNYEILLVNNNSKEETTKLFLDDLKNNSKIKIIDYNKPFNFSAINNMASKEAKGEYLLFLNNDTEVINEGWLSSMLEHAQRDEVGAVGAKLLYPNNTVQHAGVIVGIGGVAGHAFKYHPNNSPIYFNQLNVIRNYSAVTAACLMISKKLFSEVGGFDEKNLSVAYNDVDLCLRLIEKNYLVVCTPYAKLYHYEGFSRGSDEKVIYKNPKENKRFFSEKQYMNKEWGKYIENDPYYNPNFSKEREDFSINLT